MSEFDEMPIKTMKSILKGRGISTEGMLFFIIFTR